MPRRNALENVAEHALLRLGNRIAGILAFPVLSFAAHTLVQVHDDNIKMAQQIAYHEQRIVKLEDWRSGNSASKSLTFFDTENAVVNNGFVNYESSNQ